MIILGIDPGLAITGYGVIEYKGNKYRHLEHGVIRSMKTEDIPVRLSRVFTGLCSIIDKFQPESMSVEELFFNKNVKTALLVGQARGVILLAACQKGLNVCQYTPLQVKQAVVGYGRAEKQQVQFMVKAILNLEQIPTPDDAADALAIAICHGHFQSSGFNRKDIYG